VAKRLLSKLAALVPMVATASVQWAINAFTPTSGYARKGGMAYGPEPRQRLDVYIPEGARDAPVVVFLYGGGWREGHRGGYRFVGQALSARGYVTVIPDYRLYPEVRFPAFVEDGAAALAWVHRHIAAYSGNPDRVYLMGHSAGAHIGALLALDRRHLAAVGGGPDWISAFVGLAGPYDFLPFRSGFYRVIFEPEAQFPDSQPINFARAGAPPMLLMHGLRDAVVPARNTRDLAAALAAEGAEVRTVLYPRQSHVSIVAGLARPLQRLGPMLDDIVEFLAAQRGTGVSEAATAVLPAE